MIIILHVYLFFPLNPDVWGTVSDWVMVLVTFVTAILLWQTLKSQSLVQQMQKGITDKEKFKHTQSIMPYFSISGHREPAGTDLRIYITCKNFDARNVLVNAIYGAFLTGEKDKWSREVVFKGTFIEISLTMHDLSQKIVQRFSVDFEDLEGTRYNQELYYIFENSSSFKEGPIIPLDLLESLDKNN